MGGSRPITGFLPSFTVFIPGYYQSWSSSTYFEEHQPEWSQFFSYVLLGSGLPFTGCLPSFTGFYEAWSILIRTMIHLPGFYLVLPRFILSKSISFFLFLNLMRLDGVDPLFHRLFLSLVGYFFFCSITGKICWLITMECNKNEKKVTAALTKEVAALVVRFEAVAVAALARRALVVLHAAVVAAVQVETGQTFWRQIQSKTNKQTKSRSCPYKERTR